MMKNLILAASAAALLVGCPAQTPGTGMPSAAPSAMPTSGNTGGMTGDGSPAATYMQMERLARPAINEGLIITNDLLNTWNMVPPTADLSDAAKPIATEATTVLKALGNTDEQVAGLFKALLPDVMRIDTTRPSGYAGTKENPLGNVTKDLRPIGGRMITDDVIDVTLQLAVPGGGPTGTPVAGLESDNVTYAGPNANGTGHKPVLGEFPYLAAPN
jgi:hypothetical protein